MGQLLDWQVIVYDPSGAVITCWFIRDMTEFEASQEVEDQIEGIPNFGRYVVTPIQ